MSIARVTAVWNNSQHKSGALLCLLAIADFARDDGVAWPEIKTVAKKARLSPRQARRTIGELCESGELWKCRRAPGKGNVYVVLLDLTEEELISARAKVEEFTGEECDIGQIDPGHGRTEVSPPVDAPAALAMSHDPLVTVNFPSSPAPKPKREKTTHSLLQSTITKPEGDVVRSPISEYIGQQTGSPVPGGQCNKLAMGFTEHTTSGPVRHPSPDVLWNRKEPGFREYVEEQTIYFRGTGGSTAQRRLKLVNRICSYKASGYGWLDRKEKLGPDKRQWVDV